MPQELDLVDRDPNGLNSHLGVGIVIKLISKYFIPWTTDYLINGYIFFRYTNAIKLCACERRVFWQKYCYAIFTISRKANHVYGGIFRTYIVLIFISCARLFYFEDRFYFSIIWCARLFYFVDRFLVSRAHDFFLKFCIRFFFILLSHANDFFILYVVFFLVYYFLSTIFFIGLFCRFYGGILRTYIVLLFFSCARLFLFRRSFFLFYYLVRTTFLFRRSFFLFYNLVRTTFFIS